MVIGASPKAHVPVIPPTYHDMTQKWEIYWSVLYQDNDSEPFLCFLFLDNPASNLFVRRDKHKGSFSSCHFTNSVHVSTRWVHFIGDIMAPHWCTFNDLANKPGTSGLNLNYRCMFISEGAQPPLVWICVHSFIETMVKITTSHKDFDMLLVLFLH